MLKDLFFIGNSNGHKYIRIFGLTVLIKTNKYTKISQKTVEKIKKRVHKNKKCRVVFYVFEKSKWKTESLYRLLEKDERFEPLVVIGVTSERRSFYKKNELKNRIIDLSEYFESKKINVKVGYDINKQHNISLEKFKPDVVFFQQHIGMQSLNDIEMVNEYALTCYVPYFVPSYTNIDYDYKKTCKSFFRYYVLSDEVKSLYSTLNYAENNMVSVGHTALDYFYENKDVSNNNKYVIYAPHFSIQHPNIGNRFYYSTFAKYGRYILDFAKRHSDIKWVFKPHPNLKEALVKINVPKDVINKYYQEWNDIGIVNMDSDYGQLFLESKAMITDCSSFLTEYFCTGQPLIHLINTNSVNWHYDYMNPIFDTFYRVENKQELDKYLEDLIIGNNDPNKSKRIETMKQIDFSNQNAAQNILNDMSSILWEQDKCQK